MAIHHRFMPHSPLSTFIESMWYYEDDAPSHVKERRLPDGNTCLIINLREDLIRVYDRQSPDRFQSYNGCVIGGPHSQFTIIDTISQTEVMGVDFKPGCVSSFFSMPASELRNQVISLDLLWGTDAISLREQLLTARTSQHRFHILEQFLLTRLTRSTPVHPVIPFALKEFHNPACQPTVARVSERAGMSQTRFIQLFREATGLTPRQFYRVRRFQEVLHLLDSTTPVQWAGLALACGYYDQAHLIHDFQSFAGISPGSYLTLRGTYRSHLPLPG